MFKMGTFWWIAAVLINSGIGHAQEEFVAITPLEFDSDINIWDEIEYDPVQGSQQSLISLCEQYDLAINGNKIDCAKIKLSPKLENQEEHILRKRDTDEEPLEGSGTDENVPSEQPDFITKLSTQEPTVDEKRNPENAESASLGDEKEVQSSGKIDDGEELTLYNQTVDTSKEGIDEVSSKPEDGNHPNITKDLTTPNYTEDRSPNPEQSYVEHVNIEESLSSSVGVEENAQTNPQNSAVTQIQENEGQDQTSTVVDEEYQKNITPQSVLPSDLAEVKKMEKEGLDEKQSAVINFKIKESSGVEGADSDKTISKMDQNESLKSLRSSEPNAEESSKNIQKASKDTNILIILLAAVVVIGIAAFGYNRFQKRRQNNTESSGETGNIQKHLQNVTNGKSDLEQGTEMKPLIKNAEQTIINEYTDKVNNKVEAINEKH